MSYSEAPASFNVRAISPQGYDIQLTLRSEQAGELMPRVLTCLEWLEQQGFRPTGQGRAQPSSNGHHSGGNAPTCPTHNRPMKQSQHRPGEWFCTVKVSEDGGDGKPVYCRQKVRG